MINVTLGEVKTQETKPYPKLMKPSLSNNIWLMVNEKHGTLVYKGEDAAFSIGEYHFDFGNHMEDYNGSITLQNA